MVFFTRKRSLVQFQLLLPVFMNDELQTFARQYLKENLSKLSKDQHNFFKAMYGRGVIRHGNFTRSLEQAYSIPIEEIINKMPVQKLDWAMQQVKNSLNELKL